MNEIQPINLQAQLTYRATGNPPVTMPETAISNCFPGLECDFRNVWRRIFEGIVLHEADNYVVEIEKGYEDRFRQLAGCRLLYVEDDPIVAPVNGPTNPGRNHLLGITSLEWSNALAAKLQRPGAEFSCYFTAEPSQDQPMVADDNLTTDQIRDQLLKDAQRISLRIRPFFAYATQQAGGRRLAVISEHLLEPGDLTQSLCSPWQNDYRECACYYWASSRPDYVNVEPGPDGLSRGHNWLAKDHTAPADYVPDDGRDLRLVTYEDLFGSWQSLLKFQISGHDAPEEQERQRQQQQPQQLP